MSSTSTYETSLTRSVKFWTLLICQIPSVLCSIFVLYHMLSSRTHRQLLANHVVIAMLFVSLFSVTIDLSIILQFLYHGIVNPQSTGFCYFWMYIDYILYVNGILLMTWASIERHLLVFASHYFRSFRQRFYTHYLPILFCLFYPVAFYVYTISFYSCEQVFDYQRFLCSSPCFKQTSFILNGYDQLINSLVPCAVIVASSLALLIRVVRHKRRTQGQLFSWRKQHRMVVQLLSISCLYIILNAPPFFVSGIRASISRTFARVEYELYFGYLFYFLTLFLPFVCLGSLGELRLKINSLLQAIGCRCLIGTSRVDITRDQTNRTMTFVKTAMPNVYV